MTKHFDFSSISCIIKTLVGQLTYYNEARMAFYNPAAKEAVLYYAQVMTGSWGYKPDVYAKRMGWLDTDEKVTIEGQKLAKWIFESEPEF